MGPLRTDQNSPVSEISQTRDDVRVPVQSLVDPSSNLLLSAIRSLALVQGSMEGKACTSMPQNHNSWSRLRRPLTMRSLGNFRQTLLIPSGEAI